MQRKTLKHFLALFLVSCCFGGEPADHHQLTGRVTDGQVGISEVRIYPDRLHRPWPRELPPVATTDAKGCFQLEVEDSDTVLVFEKSGWQRDLVPLCELAQPLVLRKAPEHRIEKVLVVRLDGSDTPLTISDDVLRQRLFFRQPDLASAANYLYEVSKGSLELEEGAILHWKLPEEFTHAIDEQRNDLVCWVLGRLKDLKLGDLDQVDNRSGALRPDGRPDHLWIIPPGPSQTITTNHAHLSPISFLEIVPWDVKHKWSVVFFPEETPLGNIVHEAFHAMGEHRVDDFYLDEDHPDTAGIWDLMDVGMYRGWDRLHRDGGNWFLDTAYSPSQPMGWTRAELWYHGRFKATVNTLTMKGRSWTGWLDPLERAPGLYPQRLIIHDGRGKGRFWELNVRRPWGFDRGRMGDRSGPGYEGLIVTRVDPSKLTRDEPKGPVHIIDAHPHTHQPDQPRSPNGRWQLDDAAFNLGSGENPKGSDGVLSWEVLAVDAAGRMRVMVSLRGR